MDKGINRVVHFEIHAQDTAKAAEFYMMVFDWHIQKWDNPDFDYWMIMTGPDDEPGGINGGIVGRHGEIPRGGEPVSSFVCTISVENLDEMITKVQTAGGEIVTEKMTVPGVGWLAYATDLEGNIFGMMQDDPEAE